jgi:heme-degrading monooxygenase HmoA
MSMAFVSITRLRIRSARFLPAFVLHFLRARRQVSGTTGFQGGSLLADRARTFWTMTAWDDQASMRAYMMNDAHREAMPKLLDWCDEASVVHWERAEEALPSWVEADVRMRKNGRASKVMKPSSDHLSLTYRAPRMTLAGPIHPKRRN